MMNLFRKISLIAALLLVSTVIFAQDKILIRGKVTDKSSKETLIGVNVTEMDKDNRIIGGTQTDLDGNYSLTVKNAPGQTIVFSYIGYTSETVPIGTKAVIIAIE